MKTKVIGTKAYVVEVVESGELKNELVIAYREVDIERVLTAEGVKYTSITKLKDVDVILIWLEENAGKAIRRIELNEGGKEKK